MANLGLLAMFGLGQWEIMLFLLVIALLFGSARLPSLMRNMGRSVNEFKAGMKDKPADKIEDHSEEDPANA